MTKLSELRRKLLTGAFALAVALGVFGTGLSAASFVSHAETKVTIKATNGAKVRESASTSSTQVGGAEKGKVLTVISQVQGSDGYTWYQVQLDGDKTGYIRADLVDVSGDEPATGGEETPAEVTEVNPVSASVTEDSGKIRSNASSASQILKEVPKETVLTVTGQATDADGKVWYQVSFISEDAQVDGFIRSDYVSLSEDLTPKTNEPAPEEPSPEPPAEEKKPYDVIMQNGEWLLVDYYTYDEPKGWAVQDIFENLSTYEKVLPEREKDVKNQKIVIIILVFLLVAAVAGIAFLVFKIRDMMDSAYYSEVENETLRRKNASGSRGGQKVMQTVGTDRTSGRPVSAKPAGAGSSSQGARPAGGAQGTRPAGASQGTRPAGSSQGARPAGGSQGQRPVGGAQGARPSGVSQGQRSSGPSQNTRPAGGAQGARPSGAAQGQRPVAPSQGARPAGTPSGAKPAQQTHGSSQRTQPKNFMDEDDDFEFEFLNYDGEEE